jgi:hypothetical protein
MVASLSSNEIPLSPKLSFNLRASYAMWGVIISLPAGIIGAPLLAILFRINIILGVFLCMIIGALLGLYRASLWFKNFGFNFDARVEIRTGSANQRTAVFPYEEIKSVSVHEEKVTKGVSSSGFYKLGRPAFGISTGIYDVWVTTGKDAYCLRGFTRENAQKMSDFLGGRIVSPSQATRS